MPACDEKTAPWESTEKMLEIDGEAQEAAGCKTNAHQPMLF